MSGFLVRLDEALEAGLSESERQVRMAIWLTPPEEWELDHRRWSGAYAYFVTYLRMATPLSPYDDMQADMSSYRYNEPFGVNPVVRGDDADDAFHYNVYREDGSSIHLEATNISLDQFGDVVTVPGRVVKTKPRHGKTTAAKNLYAMHERHKPKRRP